jgi:hypothetical protein
MDPVMQHWTHQSVQKRLNLYYFGTINYKKVKPDQEGTIANKSQFAIFQHQ